MAGVVASDRSRHASLGGSEGSSIVRIDDDDVGGNMDQFVSPETGARSLDSTEVMFYDVSDVYIKGQDLPCLYTLGSSVQPKNGDRIAIFRVPWSSIHDFVAFVWAKESAGDVKLNGTVLHAPHQSEQTRNRSPHGKVFLASELLPQLAGLDDEEYYQFCYVSEDGEVIGSSSTFQIFSETEDMKSLVPGCEDCATARVRIQELEKALQDKELVTSYAPLNEALVEDLQKSRERLREVMDQEVALKEKLREVHEEFSDVLQALDSACGEAGGSPLAQVAHLVGKIDDLEKQRSHLQLLNEFAAQTSAGDGVSGDSRFSTLQDDPVAQLLTSKVQEVELLQSIVERKESEITDLKRELLVEKTNTDELVTAMRDEMAAKNRVLEGTIRDLQEQGKKNLEVIASVGMINHMRRERVARYFRELTKDPEHSSFALETGPIVMSILESQSQGSESSSSASVVLRSAASVSGAAAPAQARSGEDETQSVSTSIVDVTNEVKIWGNLNSVMDRSVSSQTSPVEAGPKRVSKASSVSSLPLSEPVLIERVVPVIAEQMGDLLKSAIHTVLQDTRRDGSEDGDQSGFDRGHAEHLEDADVSDYESVASRAGDVAEEPVPAGAVVHADTTTNDEQERGRVTQAGVDGGEPVATSEPDDGSVSVDTPVNAEYPEQGCRPSFAMRPPSAEGELSFLTNPPIPEMMRRYQHPDERRDGVVEEQDEEHEAADPEPEMPREPAFIRPIDTRAFIRSVAPPLRASAPVQPLPFWQAPAAPVPPFIPARPPAPCNRNPYAQAGPQHYYNNPVAHQLHYQHQFQPPYAVVAPPQPHPPPASLFPANAVQRPVPVLTSPRAPAPIPAPYPPHFGPPNVGTWTYPSPLPSSPPGAALPPPLLPQPAHGFVAGGVRADERRPDVVAAAGSASQYDFQAELESARVAALNAAARGTEAGARASSAGAAAVAPAANASCDVGVRAAERAAADGALAATRAVDAAAEVTRQALESPKRLWCPICNEVFMENDETGLNRHIDAEHMQFQCPVCSENFPREFEDDFVTHVNHCLDRSAAPNGHTPGFSRIFSAEWID